MWLVRALSGHPPPIAPAYASRSRYTGLTARRSVCWLVGRDRIELEFAHRLASWQARRAPRQITIDDDLHREALADGERRLNVDLMADEGRSPGRGPFVLTVPVLWRDLIALLR